MSFSMDSPEFQDDPQAKKAKEVTLPAGERTYGKILSSALKVITELLYFYSTAMHVAISQKPFLSDRVRYSKQSLAETELYRVLLPHPTDRSTWISFWRRTRKDTCPK